MAVSVLRRYITRELVTTTGVITLVLMLIVLSARLIVYLNKAATGEISTQLVFSIVGYNLPFFLQLILPLGYFIAILLALGRMYAENEMVVLNACGINPTQLLKTVALPTIIIAALSAFLALWLSPWGANKVDALLEAQKERTDLKFITPGRFTSLGNNSRVTYTEKSLKESDGLGGVFVGSPTDIVIAKSAHQNHLGKEDERYLILEDGYQLSLNANGTTDILEFGQYAIKIPGATSAVAKSRHEAKPTLALLDSNEPKDVGQLSLRLAMVIMVPIATLLAFPLSKVQPRQGRFAKLLPAILLYVLYYSAIILMTSLISEGKAPIFIGTWWIHTLFFLLALLLNIWPDIQSRYRERQQQRRMLGQGV